MLLQVNDVAEKAPQNGVDFAHLEYIVRPGMDASDLVLFGVV